MERVTHSAEESQQLAFSIGKVAGAGSVFALMGPLGVGKTCFAQALLAGLGVTDSVTSPTFTLIAEYVGRLPVIHIDAYRLPDPQEWRDLGLDDYLQRGTVLVAEWADLLIDVLPDERLDVFFSYAPQYSSSSRIIKFSPRGSGHTALLQRALETG